MRPRQWMLSAIVLLSFVGFGLGSSLHASESATESSPTEPGSDAGGELTSEGVDPQAGEGESSPPEAEGESEGETNPAFAAGAASGCDGDPLEDALEGGDPTPGGGSVSLFDGRLAIRNPLFSAPVGGTLINALTATHDSKVVWHLDSDVVRSQSVFPIPLGQTELGLGWRLSLGMIRRGSGNNNHAIVLPDGTEHALFSLGTTFGGTMGVLDYAAADYGLDLHYFTRDSSAIRVVASGDRGCWPYSWEHSSSPRVQAAAATTWRAFLPDGTWLEYDHHVHHPPGPGPPGFTCWSSHESFEENNRERFINGWYVTTIIDPAGNRIDVEYHDAPNDHVIKRITDSHCREITTELHQNEPPGRERINGLVKSVTYPVFDGDQNLPPCTFDTVTTVFSYEQRQVHLPLREWIEGPPPPTPPAHLLCDVPLLTSISTPVTLSEHGVATGATTWEHQFDYNIHGELTHHRIPEGALVTYGYEYFMGVADDEFTRFKGRRHPGNRGVWLRRTYVDGDEQNDAPDNMYEWIYLRKKKDAFSCSTAPAQHQHRVRRRDPEGKWTHYYYAQWPADIYWLQWEWSSGYPTTPLIEEVITWDRPFGSWAADGTFDEQVDDCWNLPAGVQPALTRQYKWRGDDPIVPTGTCDRYAGCWRAADFNPRLIQARITFDDGSWVQKDSCGWDGLGNFEWTARRGSSHLVEVPRTTRIQRSHVPCNNLFGLAVRETVSEGTSQAVSERRFDVEGRVVEELRRASFEVLPHDHQDPDFSSEPGYCLHDPNLPSLTLDNGPFVTEEWLAEPANWPNLLPLSTMECGGLVDPAARPGCVHAPPPLVPQPGDVTRTHAYHASACDSPNVGGNGRKAWGQLKSATLTGGDGGAPITENFEWSFGVMEQSWYDGLPWKSTDQDIDPGTGLVSAKRDPAGFEVRLFHDELGREVYVEPAATVPAPSSGADREAPISTTYSADHASMDVVQRLPQAPVESGTETYLTHDGLGRLIRTERRMPVGDLAVQQLRHDALDRVVFQSEWVRGDTIPRQPLVGLPGASYDFSHAPQPGDVIPDPLGRLRRVLQADGAEVRHDHEGRVETRTVPGINGIGSANALTSITEYHHDGYGRLIRVVTPVGGADATYEHDFFGNLVRVDLDGQERTFEHDALGRLRTRIEPESGSTEFVKYDASGNLLEKLDANGDRLTYEYDAAGRLLWVQVDGWPAGIRVKDFRYDEAAGGPHAVGKLTTALSATPDGQHSIESYEHAGLSGRLSGITHVMQLPSGAGTRQWEISQGYDSLGNVSSIRYPSLPGQAGREVVYEHFHGLPINARDGEGRALVNAATYTPAGGIRTLSYGNGHATLTDVDVRNRPSRIRVVSHEVPLEWVPGGPSGSGIDQLPIVWDSGTYVYDGAGNVIAIGTDSDAPLPTVAESYRYDEHGRLVQAERSQGDSRTIQYEWDAWGNMTSRLHDDFGGDPCAGAGALLEFDGRAYDAGQGGVPSAITTNRISDYASPCHPTASVQYDSAGNVTSDAEASYSHDPLGRVQSTHVHATGTSLECRYDASDRRIVQAPTAGSATYYLRGNDGRTLSEWDDAQTLETEFIYFGGMMVAERLGDATSEDFRWHHLDHVGSTKIMVNGGLPNTVEHVFQSPFGVVLNDCPAGADAKYAGHEREEYTSNVYMLARYYSPSQAQFLASDPAMDSASLDLPISWHRFAYAAANPLKYVDPDGRRNVLAADASHPRQLAKGIVRWQRHPEFKKLWDTLEGHPATFVWNTGSNGGAPGAIHTDGGKFGGENVTLEGGVIELRFDIGRIAELLLGGTGKNKDDSPYRGLNETGPHEGKHGLQLIINGLEFPDTEEGEVEAAKFGEQVYQWLKDNGGLKKLTKAEKKQVRSLLKNAVPMSELLGNGDK